MQLAYTHLQALQPLPIQQLHVLSYKHSHNDTTVTETIVKNSVNTQQHQAFYTHRKK